MSGPQKAEMPEQHERVTNADRVLQDTEQRFRTEGTPKVTHLVAAEAGDGVQSE
jgi:hypothetical protein